MCFGGGGALERSRGRVPWDIFPFFYSEASLLLLSTTKLCKKNFCSYCTNFLYRNEIVNMNTKQKPDWFMAKNPNGTVPVLETSSGQVVYESPITCDFLEETYPENKLYPSDPFEKAQQKMLLEEYSKVGNFCAQRYHLNFRCMIHLLSDLLLHLLYPHNLYKSKCTHSNNYKQQ